MLYKNFLKQAFDFIISFICLLCISPIFLIIWILILISNRGNAFFIQRRPGKNENIFYIYKFRTMTNVKNANGDLADDCDRITRLGRFLRHTSLDELPQLINIIKGDLSLVGPRPLLEEYLPLYNEQQKRRHLIKPGITGWAQVNGRNAITWDEKLKLDVWYVDNLNFILDVKILTLTLKKVFKSENINTSDTNTMDKFKGTEEFIKPT